MSAFFAALAILGQNGTMPPAKLNLSDLTDSSELRGVIERFLDDRDLLRRSIPVSVSPVGRKQMQVFLDRWGKGLSEVGYSKLSPEAQVDYHLLSNHIKSRLRGQESEEGDFTKAEAAIGFSEQIWELRESLRQMERIDPEPTASKLTALSKTVKDAATNLAKSKPKLTLAQAKKAVAIAGTMRDELKEWFDFYNGYDPMFTWWCAEPYKQVDASLDDYAKKLKEALIPDEKDDRVPPIGAEGLQADLDAEMIPYTAAELVKIAEREFAWCEAEMKKAAKDLGYKDDWKKALEHVKALHVAPGEQPQMIKELALEAIDFMEKHDLLTVPDLAKQTWRMTMMSPERQRTSPFFLGGEVIMVSFPTNTMTHEEKLMSMRGNNRHFARATVHHELIPGHHLQGFMTDRYRAYRRPFSTPFWIEGWALYWEMLLWKMGFPQTPENKIGMLFWRMHRCARIIFSLNYHLGTMKPDECVNLLVDKVGHERANAEAEVRRSFNGSYPPLYQAAYMLGALQIWRLREEVVDSGKMKEKAFHDAILHENSIPIELLRAILLKQPLARDFKTSWRFYPALDSPAPKPSAGKAPKKK